MKHPAVALLIAVVATLTLVYFNGASLMRDYRLRNQQFVPAQASISEARCRTYWLVYTSCNVSYSTRQAPQQTESLHYSFLGPVHEKTVRLVRPVNDQQVVVADIGIDRITNRVLLFVVAFAGFGSLGFFSVRKMAVEA